MTDRSAFSDEQWHTLTDAPVAILLALGLVGEHGTISMMKESAAGAKAIARPLHSGPADQLIAEIVPEAGNKEARHDAKQHKGATPNVVVDGLLDDVAKAVEVLAVLPADEAAQVRQWALWTSARRSPMPRRVSSPPSRTSSTGSVRSSASSGASLK